MNWRPVLVGAAFGVMFVTIVTLARQPREQTVVVLWPPQFVVPDGDELELWAFKSGEEPHSLGEVTAYGTTKLPPLAAGTVLAVSLEPKGGSPTKLPTGPSLFTNTRLPTR